MGQFSAQEVADGLATGKFFATDLGWTQGMESWVALSEFPGLPPALPDAAVESPRGDDAPLLAPGTALPSEPIPQPAWERRQQVGIFPALFESLRQILLQPGETFAAMPKEGDYKSPLIYTIIMVWIGSLFSSLYSGIQMVLNPAEFEPVLQETGTSVLIGGYVIFMVFLPVLTLIFSFFHAGILHLLLLIFGAGKGNFETTLRVMCYSQGASSILQLLPMCGGFLSPIFYVYTCAVGLSRAREIPVWKSVLVVLFPTLFCCALILALLFTAFSAMGMEGLKALEGLEGSGALPPTP